MRKLYMRFLALAKFICLMCFASYSFAQVSGTVYQDFNGNGLKDNSATFNEVGLRGVTVIATNSAGTALTVTYTGNGTSTNTTGEYSVAGGTLGQIRLEFIMPDGHTFASKGGVSGTSIMFPTGATQNLGVFYPQNYSAETNPRVAVQWYTNGNNQLPGTTATTPQSLVTFPHDNNGTVNSLANMGSIGATWGLAYHKQSGKLFSAAFAKRHVNTGSLGLAGIYVTANAKTANSLTATSTFVNLTGVNPAFNAGTVTRDFTPGLGNAGTGNFDVAMFDQVGKVGMGDLSVSDDGQYLYTINLNDRRLWRIEVGAAGTAPTSASQIVQYGAFPKPCTSSTFRPFAVRYYKGDIYVGGVCDGVAGDNSTVDRNNLKVTIYKVSGSANPSGAAFTEVFSFPLTYSRNANVEGLIKADTRYYDPNNTAGITTIGGASWRPWLRSYNDMPASYVATNQAYAAYPQPMLIGLEFDVDGSMILGFGDRTGHQMGNANRLPINGTTREMTFTSGGDLLRAYNNNGTYELENNGIAGSLSTGGANNGQGPGGGEFYWRDVYHFGTGATAPYGVRSGNERNFHEETSLGGLTSMAGKGSVLVTSFDPLRTNFNEGQFSGGIRWYSNTDGAIENGLTLYNWTSTNNTMDRSTFGKAGGIGDIELMTNPAPIEIGNRVWLDTNNNGIQDAGENGLPGITVTLYAADGTTVIATAVTNAQGEYYFSSAPGTNTTNAIYGLNILPQTAYVLSYPTTSGVNLISTKPNSGTNDLLDSDADELGKITFTTGSAGENNHSFDVGYFVCPTVTAPVIANAARCDEGTFTASITTGCTSGYSLNIFSDEALTNNVTSSFTISGTSITSPSLSATTTYHVNCSDGVCSSTKSSFELTINSAPAISVNSPEICAGETATLEVTGCVGGTITWTNGLTGATATTPALTTSTMYTATCTVGDCISTAFASVTVNALPVITVDKPTICSGETATLTVTGCEGGTITWTGGLSGTSAVTPVLTETTSYIATCSEGGCSSTAVVTVVSAPAISVNSPEICAGETATLEVTGCAGGTITWTNGLTGTTATTPALTTSTTYTATCTVGDCISTAVASVTVNALPVITVDKPTICSGETAILTVTGCEGGTITWTGGLSGTSAVTPVLTETTSYIATCSEGGCSSTAVVTVVSAPAISVNSPEICAGETATLEVTGCTGGTITWTNGLTGTTATTPALTASATYTATCTVGDCISTAVASVTVNALPVITVDKPTICSGETATLTVTGCEGGTITWSGGLSGTSAVTPVLTETTSYIATCSEGGCSSTAVVTVVSAPAISVNSPEICAGETATLEVTGCTGGTITWTNGLTGTTATTPALIASATYTATCTVGDCISTAVASVTVNALPVITVVGEPVCAPDGLSYSVLFTIPAGAILSNTTAGIIDGDSVVNILSGATAVVTVKSAEGCENTATVTYNCELPCVAPNPTVVGTAEICVGESAILEAEGCTTGFTYLWSTNETTASITVNPTATTVYTVRCVNEDDAACVSVTPASATITVNEKAAAPTGITATPSEVILGDESVLTATCAGGLTPSWFEDSALTTPLASTTVSPTVNSTYYVICGVDKTCAEIEDITVTVTDAPCVAPNPTVDGTAEICVGESAILEAEGCTTGFTYLWSTNETTASITVNPTETTVYTVKCVNEDDAACVSVTPALPQLQ